MTPEDSAQIEAMIAASEQRITTTITNTLTDIITNTLTDTLTSIITTRLTDTLTAIITTKLTAAIETITTAFDTAIAAAEERAVERARDLQTEVLRGLEAFARGNFARFHSVESNQTDINIRMAALEERVLYLETRRPPQ